MKEEIARAIRDLIYAELERFRDPGMKTEEFAEQAYKALLVAGEGATQKEVSGG